MSDDQFNRLFNYMQDKFDDIDRRFDEMDKKIDKNHSTVMSHIDALSGDISDMKDEIKVIGYKVTRLEEWVTAFKY